MTVKWLSFKFITVINRSELSCARHFFLSFVTSQVRWKWHETLKNPERKWCNQLSNYSARSQEEICYKMVEFKQTKNSPLLFNPLSAIFGYTRLTPKAFAAPVAPCTGKIINSFRVLKEEKICNKIWYTTLCI